MCIRDSYRTERTTHGYTIKSFCKNRRCIGLQNDHIGRLLCQHTMRQSSSQPRQSSSSETSEGCQGHTLIVQCTEFLAHMASCTPELQNTVCACVDEHSCHCCLRQPEKSAIVEHALANACLLYTSRCV